MSGVETFSGVYVLAMCLWHHARVTSPAIAKCTLQNDSLARSPGSFI